MATSTPSGTLLAIAATFQRPQNRLRRFSNAAEAVVSCTAHGFSVGDIVQIYSGWGRLNRGGQSSVKSVTADTFVAELIDTTSTDLLPHPARGNGTVRKVLTWQSDQQLQGPAAPPAASPRPSPFKWTDSRQRRVPQRRLSPP
jgi:hypothetical protein